MPGLFGIFEQRAVELQKGLPTFDGTTPSGIGIFEQRAVELQKGLPKFPQPEV